MRLIESSNSEFPKYWNELASKALVTPIYSTDHQKYYESIAPSPNAIDLSAVVVCDEIPIAGLRIFMTENGNQTRALDYFGMSAPLILPDVQQHQSAASVEMLSQFLFSKSLKGMLSDDNTEFKVLIPLQGPRSSKIIDLFLENSHRIHMDFMRVVELGADDFGAGPRKTKSIKGALKSAEILGMKCQVIDKNSEPDDIYWGMRKLQELHLASAGRATRSQKSWDEQSQAILRGSAFLVLGTLDDQTVGAAYFLNNATSAYYGVSANSTEFQHVSSSHVLIVEALKYLTHNSYSRLFLGSQYSDRSQKISPKELQIERFKSLFGGRVAFNLIVEK
jgi:hypothetical protein